MKAKHILLLLLALLGSCREETSVERAERELKAWERASRRAQQESDRN